ncbi:glycosyltransferase family 22 protein [Tilletiaria anomala UBC 951]|uniref:Mannosyltransferase n=1 Tax=Tilletiaria anomala (strain ATCC 24038 / CBS 436.72 / UBC 951) TaxID=1037660 RepID=A0A066WM10_TILAU|nr:glycosyltransferase family 22 protein [Tilletiaria anomala UBC 951]KDN52039.1 glycosyltransferase family 22 protein [Tilletiaria anomala UBC 951]
MMGVSSKVRLSLLLLPRVAVALLGYAYIHPDEWHQSGEYLALQYAGIPTVLPWEFEIALPCRSVASISFFNAPFIGLTYLRSHLGFGPSARDLFLVQRGTFVVYSFLNDWMVRWLCRKHDKAYRSTVRLLLSTSHAGVVFMARPFTNSIEAVLLTAAFCCVDSLSELPDQLYYTSSKSSLRAALWTHWAIRSFSLGACFAFGFFARFTFAIFALPCGLLYLYIAGTMRGSFRTASLVPAALPAAAGFAIVSAAHILFDTIHFRRRELWPPVITPVNAFSYNLQAQNLARHGIHPRWLHVLVNAPMLLGVPAYGCFLFMMLTPRPFARQKSASMAPLQPLCLATIVCGLALLSIQPHQEPRFLLALITPVTLIFATQAQNNRRWRKWLIRLHILQSIAMVALFGFLHQAGVTPSLLQINDAVRAVQAGRPHGQRLIYARPGDTAVSVHVWSWKLFMPPAHQVVSTRAGCMYGFGTARDGPAVTVTLYDPPGEELHELAALVDHKVQEDAQKGLRQTHLVLAPSWDDLALQAEQPGTHGANFSMQLVHSVGPHLDLDHLPQLIQRWRRAASWWPEMHVEIFRVTRTPSGLLPAEDLGS